jgi:hypothetical protein
MKKVLGMMAGFIFSIFGLAILGLLMTLTYGALGKLFPNSFTNQMWGMVVFDIATMCWALAFVFKSQAVMQYAAAATGFLIGFAGTLLMVAAEVIMDGQTFVKNNNMGQWMVYGFIAVTALHAILIYMHHAGDPEITTRIELGIAQGEVTTEAISQAKDELEHDRTQLAIPIRVGMVNQVKRDLKIPIAVDPNIGFVPTDPAAYEYAMLQQQPAGTNSPRQAPAPSWLQQLRQKFSRQSVPAIVQTPAAISTPAPTQEEPPTPDAPFPSQAGD